MVTLFLKKTWTAAPSQTVSTASCASHAAGLEVPAERPARQHLHTAGPSLLSGGQSCAFPVLKSSSLDKYPAGSHVRTGASFLLNQEIRREEPWLFQVPANADKSADVAMLPHDTAIWHVVP